MLASAPSAPSTSLGLLFFFLALTACGATTTIGGPSGAGAGAGAGTGSGGDDDNVTVTGQPLQGITGSFDLSFTSAQATSQDGPPQPAAPSTAPPSLSAGARLDIHQNSAGTYEAVVTGRDDTPSAYAVEVANGSVTLTGGEGTIATSRGIGVADVWKTLILARDAAGNLTGDVTGQGEEQERGGDFVVSYDLAGTGRIARDATVPTLTATASRSFGPAEAYLPWAPIYVRAAEPVAAAGVQGATRLTSSAGAPAPLRWDPITESPTSWTGEVTFSGHLDDWTLAANGGPWTLVNDGALATDLLGHGASPLSFQVPMLPLPGPTASVDFAGDVVPAAIWGSMMIYGGPSAGAPDARCESGSCLRLGPVEDGYCQTDRSGLAAQIMPGASGHVSIRYRALARADQSSAAPTIFGSVLDAELASRDGTIAETPVAGSSAVFSPLDTPNDGLTFATPWTTLDLTVPPGAGPFGLAVVVGTPSLSPDGECGGPLPPPTDVELLIESVTAS